MIQWHHLIALLRSQRSSRETLAEYGGDKISFLTQLVFTSSHNDSGGPTAKHNSFQLQLQLARMRRVVNCDKQCVAAGETTRATLRTCIHCTTTVGHVSADLFQDERNEAHQPRSNGSSWGLFAGQAKAQRTRLALI